MLDELLIWYDLSIRDYSAGSPSLGGRMSERMPLDERVFFGLSEKVQVAIFEFRRTGYDENGTPIRFTVTVYPADRNQFQMEAGPVPPRVE